MRSIVLLSTLFGCADPAATDALRGTPLITVSALTSLPVSAAAEEAAAAGRLRHALFWSGPAIEDVVEHGGDRRPRADGRFTLHLFDVDPLPGPWAVGQLWVYDDADGDGRRGAAEAPLGGFVAEGVLLVTEPLTAEASPTRVALAPGLHRVVLPLRCAASPAPTGAEACATPTGAACRDERSCAGGGCLYRSPRPWGTRMCAVLGRTPACTPTDAAWLPGVDESFWLPRCAEDADCPHPDQSCASAHGACLSAGDGEFVVHTTWRAPAICATEDQP